MKGRPHIVPNGLHRGASNSHEMAKLDVVEPVQTQFTDDDSFEPCPVTKLL